MFCGFGNLPAADARNLLHLGTFLARVLWSRSVSHLLRSRCGNDRNAQPFLSVREHRLRGAVQQLASSVNGADDGRRRESSENRLDSAAAAVARYSSVLLSELSVFVLESLSLSVVGRRSVVGVQCTTSERRIVRCVFCSKSHIHCRCVLMLLLRNGVLRIYLL